ncbi:hypothetical protein L1049_012208 [Liquidambar formosana]|uniref:hAT-like transposase RNase-H fold domain-containing protein n=1 Tax=Liquidambar formosana TaxID=63359 RepID=A0AAP0RXR4_LIQFO
MIIVDELLFRHLEKEGFRSFCAVLEPKFTLLCRTTVTRDSMKLFYEEKGKLKKALKKQRICLTTYTWTSIQNLNYMCLIAHWIDANWNLQKRILNFCLVPNHKGETIGKHVKKCLLEWGINKIFTITVDDASSNDGAIRYLERKTKDWNSTILEHEFIHMRCCAHIVNFIVCEGLKDQNESIAKIRNVVWYVRSSPFRFQTFKNCVEHGKIPSKSLEDEDENEGGKGRGRGRGRKRIGPLTMDDWDNARVFIRFLKLFYNVTLKFSRSLYVTSNAFSHKLMAVQSKLISLCKSGDRVLGDMANLMRRKYDKYWENFDNINFLLYVAVVLDPCYKLRYVRFSFAQVYENSMAKELTERVKFKLIHLYGHYVKKDSCANVTTSSASQASQAMEIDENEEDASKLWAFQYKKHLEEEYSIKNKLGVERFLAENCEDPSNSSFDILAW